MEPASESGADLASVVSWFTGHGFGLAFIEDDGFVWAHLTRGPESPDVFAPRYGRGPTQTDAALSAKRRYQVEQLGEDADAHAQHVRRTDGGFVADRSRLQSVAPELDTMLQAVGPRARLDVGLSVARFAVESVGLDEPVAAAALAIRSGDAAELGALVARLDEQYFALEDLNELGQAYPSQVLEAFSKARAAAAVEFAVRGEYAEAVYEAGMATDDWAAIRAIVEASRPDA